MRKQYGMDRDPELEKFKAGSGINHSGIATLLDTILIFSVCVSLSLQNGTEAGIQEDDPASSSVLPIGNIFHQFSHLFMFFFNDLTSLLVAVFAFLLSFLQRNPIFPKFHQACSNKTVLLIRTCIFKHLEFI